MELNITRLFKTINPKEYSASIAELGKNAGPITWHNALANAPSLLKTKTQLSEFKKYLESFGAWSEAELKHYSKKECNALLLQLISGDIRESELDLKNPDWHKYEGDSINGHIAGGLFLGTDNAVYYYIGV